jgi:hypothetical protein
VIALRLPLFVPLFTCERELNRPSPSFTFYWGIAHRSIEKLAGLEPEVVAAGHG